MEVNVYVPEVDALIEFPVEPLLHKFKYADATERVTELPTTAVSLLAVILFVLGLKMTCTVSLLKQKFASIICTQRNPALVTIRLEDIELLSQVRL
jgi:hypothetical protein